jgi:hypothetical protein
MSLRVDFKAKMGEVMLKQNDNLFAIDICQANATCAFIYKYKNEEGEVEHILQGFFADKQHINNLIKRKTELFYGKILSVKLNMWYKESADVLKYFTRMGHKVECYYNEPTDKTERV